MSSFLGARLSNRSAENLGKIAELTAVVPVIAIDEPCARAFAEIRLKLRRCGKPTGDLDSLIAATASAQNATLVTHNTRHFENIDGLSLEDWLAPVP